VHKNPSLQDCVVEQSASVGNWQTVVLSTFTHWPAEQSADVWQASWHLPTVHTRGWMQSLFMMQLPPTSILLAELQPAASEAETTIKPRMRNHDTDISLLQLCVADRKDRAPRKYHSTGRSRAKPSGHRPGARSRAL
jgi:hypothetical protein